MGSDLHLVWPPPLVWPPEEERFVIEAERILNEMQTNAHVSRDRGDKEYIIDYTRLAMLIKVAIPKIPDSQNAFMAAGRTLGEALPRSAARSCIEQIFSIDNFGFEKLGGVMRLYREARWHEHGRPCVRIDAKLAAAQMASDVSEDMLDELDDLRAPWPSFVIRLPPEIVMKDSLGRRYTSLAVHRFIREGISEELAREAESQVPEELRDFVRTMNDKMKSLVDFSGPKWGLYLLTEDGNGGFQEEAALAQFMGKRNREYLFEPEKEPPAHALRLLEAASRLAAGVCFLIHDSGMRRVSEKKGTNRWRLSKLPQTTEYIVGENVRVTIDCREAVSEYIGGERSAMPKIQWLVRGHWRWQPHGPNRTLRRRQFIEPYWKGPERAPILTRTHVVQDPEND